MTNVLHNRLLIASLSTVFIYIMVGVFTPNPYMSSAMSLLSLLAGAMMFIRYVEFAYKILILGLRSEENSGSHYAVLGATLLSGGAIYGGMFGLIWVWFGQPQEWTGTAVSSFGRFMMAIGFWLMFISPDAADASSRLPSNFWRAVLTVLAIVIAFVAGTHFANLQ